MNVTIRQATIEDLDKLLPLKLESKTEERKLNKELLPINKVKENYKLYLEKDLDSDYRAVIIALVDNKPVGLILGRIYRSLKVLGYERRASMGNLYVQPKYRGKGIAKKLVNGFIEWCKSKKVKKITLSIYKENEFVKKIYHKIGFKDQFITMHKKV